MIFDSNIIYLLAIWFLGWGLYFYAGKRKMALAYNTDFVTFYFFFLAAFTFFISKPNFPDFIVHNIFFYFTAVLIVFIAINHIYFLINKKFKEPLVLEIEHPTDQWLKANRQSIFVTLCHIIFQQMVITGIILSLSGHYGDIWATAWHFALIFGLMHIFIVLFKGFKFMILYTLPAMAAALIFPVLLLKFNFGGLVLNYLIHASFYVLITYLFWRKEGKINS